MRAESVRDEKGTVASKSLNASSASSFIPHAAALILLAFIAYSTVLDSYFLSDDFVQIGKVLEGDWSVTWARETGGFFRPLFVWSYIVDSRLWKDNPLGYHLTNTLLHALNSILVYSLTLRLLRHQKLSSERRRGIALVAGLLFLLHPSHTEAVSWISGRVDLLPTLFCLTTLLAYISYAETRKAFSFILALLAFALALLAKESAVSLPFILFAAGIFSAPVERRRAALKDSLKMVAPFFLILSLFILIRRVALGVWVGGYGTGQHLNFSLGWIRDRFLQATLRALFPALPLELSPILLKPLKSVVFILCALACAGLIIILVKRRRTIYDRTARREQNKLALLLPVMFLFSLLPVINLRLSLFNTQGDRFVYWPSVFTSILIAYVASIILRSAKWWLALMLCVLVFYSISLYRTNRTWREAAAMSRSIKDELARAVSNGKSLLALNAPDNLRGVPVFHNGLEEALRIFQREGRIETTGVLALHDLQSQADEIELKREGDQFSLRLLNPVDGFTRVADRPECVEVREHSTYSLRFSLNNCTDSFDLFFFTGGKMYKVISSEQEDAPPKAQAQ